MDAPPARRHCKRGIRTGGGLQPSLPWPTLAVAEPVDAPPSGTVRAVIQQVLARLDTRYAIGLPGATDIDFAPLYPVLNRLVINHGDPEIDGVDPRHVKDIERD